MWSDVRGSVRRRRTMQHTRWYCEWRALVDLVAWTLLTTDHWPVWTSKTPAPRTSNTLRRPRWSGCTNNSRILVFFAIKYRKLHSVSSITVARNRKQKKTKILWQYGIVWYKYRNLWMWYCYAALSPNFYYLCQEGYVLSGVCPSVCLSVKNFMYVWDI